MQPLLNEDILNTYEYLKPEKVMDRDVNNMGSEFIIHGNCYFHGSSWICPNPMNKSLCSQIEEHYQIYYYVQKKEFAITYDEYNDKDNWVNELKKN